MLTPVEIFGKPALQQGPWVFRRDVNEHVRVIFSDVSALELDDEEWQQIKDFFDADAEAAPA